jgi:sarcosine oxidase
VDCSRRHDVIVVGLGAMGSATVSYELARRGQRVLGLERFGPAHSEASSHGGTCLVRQVCWEDPAYVPLAQRTFELWRDTERISGQVLLRPTGGLVLGPPESATVYVAQLLGRVLAHTRTKLRRPHQVREEHDRG